MANRYVAFADWEIEALRAGKKSVFRRPVFPRAHSAELARAMLDEKPTIEQRGHSLRATFTGRDGRRWEAWAPHDLQTPISVREKWAQGPGGSILYRSGYMHEGIGPRPRWRPANAMAIAKTRYTLIINDARIERLHELTDDISREYEGIEFPGFQEQWQASFGKTHPWEANDFVWVFSFVATRVYSPPAG